MARNRRTATVYWDACCFISVLSNERNAKDCLKVVKAAEDGHIRIVTSSISLVEVIKYNGKPPIAEADQSKVDAAMSGSHFEIRNVDRLTGQLARRLIWEKDLAVKDSIHVATALLAGVRELHTTDKDLLKLSPLEFEGYGPLRIQRPDWIDPSSPEALGIRSLFEEAEEVEEVDASAPDGSADDSEEGEDRI